MQFTPQQLAGAQRYGSNTRIGNWLEDCKLKETKIAEFCEAKEYVRWSPGVAGKGSPVPSLPSSLSPVRLNQTVHTTRARFPL